MSRLTLSTCIIDSLKAREMVQEFPEALLAQHRTEVIHHDETELWDYKERMDFDNPIDVSNVAKHLLGFHNAKGGALIIGISDAYKVVGINESQILDTNRLMSKLRKYIGSNVPIFQDKFQASNGRFIWVLFATRRESEPAFVMSNGPEKNGALVMKSGEYYMRIADQTRLCVDPNDIRILFSGYSTDHLMGYSYDLDLPYFRLLSPHCDRFFGRTKIIQNVHQVLVDSRQPIVALDGTGGVGKSAVAIELVRQLYENRSFDFIVSLSAKNKVWDSHIRTRRAGFSGMTEMLQEIAKVIEINIEGEPESLKTKINGFMKSYKGLLLIDNIEEIQDHDIFAFLDNVPEPSKVMVTSRVDKGLGAKTISIPEMTDDEAKELLFYELRKVGYLDYLENPDSVNEILLITGKLPLALKWAASLAGDSNSLKSVSQILRSSNHGNKKEFLNFCFATMYDSLPPLSKEVALLGAYLGEEWNALTVSLALDQPVGDIEDSIQDLKDRGILLAAGTKKDRGLNVLPLTLDFLATKWNENAKLRDRVNNTFVHLLASKGDEGFIFLWPNERKVTVLRDRAVEFAESKEYEKSLRLIKLAAHYSPDPNLMFLQGKISYQSGRIQDGLSQMRIAREKLKENNLELSFESMFFLGKAISSHGLASEEKEALNLLFQSIPHLRTVTKLEFSEYINRAIQIREFALIQLIIASMLKEPRLLYVVEAMWDQLDKENVLHHVGNMAIKALRKLAEEDYGITYTKNEILSKLHSIENIMNKMKKE